MRFRHPWISSVAATGLTAGFRMLFATVRNDDRLFPKTSPFVPIEDQELLYCVWHDSILFPMFCGRQPSTVALVSQHGDGAYVAKTLKRVGIGSVRGSSSRGGAKAVRQLVEQTRECHLVVTPDGPRGPRRQLKSGITYIASKTGKPIVPTAFGASRFWSFEGNWTNLVVPKPFSTAYLLTGEPIAVPKKAKREELDEYTAVVQSEMDRLNLKLERLTGIADPMAAKEPDVQKAELRKAA